MTRIIYVYDALCGWCYGFSAVMQRFYHEHRDQLNFTVLSGGMMTGDRARPIAESMAYISEAYRVVEERTGVQFGQPFLDNILHPGTYISSSEKPGMAMTLFKTAQTGREVEFAGELQNALYRDGLDLNVDAVYGPLVERFGLNPGEFVKHVSDAAIREQTLAEFGLVAQFGINGFPTVIVEKGENLYLVARGYVPYPTLAANIGRALAMNQ